MLAKLAFACSAANVAEALQAKKSSTVDSSCGNGAEGHDVAFSKYVEVHERTYKAGTDEFLMRRTVFGEKLTAIEHNNCKAGNTWTAALNKFTDRTDAELAHYRGYNRHAKSSSSSSYTALSGVHEKKYLHSDIPSNVSYEHLNAMQAISDQANCGSCWAEAIGKVLDAHSELYEKPRAFSVQELVSCTPNEKKCGGTGGCEGATGELALDYVMEYGCRTEEEFPYEGTDLTCPNSLAEKPSAHQGAAALGISRWLQLTSNKQEPLMQHLYLLGPVAVSVAADGGWFSYYSGIMNSCSNDDPVVNHLVVLIGYGGEDEDLFWNIQNSWGSDWGEQGHMKLIRTEDEESYCGMDDQPQDGVACEGEDDPVKVCGHCGMLYDSVVPVFAKAESKLS